jgi:hypothetical protein
MYCQPAAVVIEGYDHMCPWTGTMMMLYTILTILTILTVGTARMLYTILTILAILTIGTAIGKGNLNYFWAFAGSLNLLLYYNFGIIIYGLVMRFK